MSEVCWAGNTRPHDAGIRKLEPHPSKQVDLPDYGAGAIRGLSLRMSPGGVKTWVYRYRNSLGRQCRISIGRYPEVGVAAARRQAEIYRAQVHEQRDPAAEKRERRSTDQAHAEWTVNKTLDAYFEAARAGRHRRNMKTALPKRESTVALEEYYADRFIRPRLGKRVMASITSTMITALLDELINRDKLTNARQSHVVLRQLFGFARWKKMIDANPMDDVDKPPAASSRDRVLSDLELRHIWLCSSRLAEEEDISELLADEQDPPNVSQGMALATMLCASTLQRAGEVAGMHANEIDLGRKTWTIPGARTKNKRTHVVPLSPLALLLIRRAFALPRPTDKEETFQELATRNDQRPELEGWAFPSRRNDGPVQRHAVTRAMARMREAIGVADATPHDLRRTGATRMTEERLAIPRFVVSRVLNHTSDTGGAAGVTAVYDRNEYLAEKRTALESWAIELERIGGSSIAEGEP